MSQLGLILLSVFLGSIGQILLKAGADRLGDFELSLRTFFQVIWSVLKTPQLFIGLIFFGLSFLVWVKVLTKSELSYAYPMVSLNYALIALASAVFFNEPLTVNKLTGIGIIMLGVFLINR